jgi:hypothetical protein
MSVEVLKLLVFVVAIAVGLGMFFIHGRRWQWPVFEAAFTYIIANLALVIYVLSRPLDPRWSAGKETTVDAPDLPQGPVVDIVTNPLSDFFGGVTGNVNAVVNTGATALDLLIWTGYGLVAAIVFFIVAKMKDQRDQRALFSRVKEIERRLDRLTGPSR